MQPVQLAGHALPPIGQGTWHMGEDPDRRQDEIAALRLGLELGLTVIDTAEMYADGESEQVVAQAIRGVTDPFYLVSKVYPHNASRDGVVKACERSLKRLGVEHLDLYLLHWPGQYPLEDTLEGFERLRDAGKIAAWGLSNFDVPDLQGVALNGCATQQVLYNPEARGVEFDLLPWAEQRGMPVMAYCPLGQGGRFLDHPALQRIAARLTVTPAEVCLAWVIRSGHVMAIPKAVDPVHVRLNARAAQLTLAPEDLAALDAAFPPPGRKQRLRMV
ncbi:MULTISPECIES: aldo/keto reductase [Pseudomonas]|uniref:Aldo/keto reductase n=1 Tax=Pseudomonas quercus TaxID=2722792 RepID=A0ABX0YBK3_9PSED|nr:MULTISPECIES: aldo/keto reductase [Pseudomonas]MBF7141124.1 aldo/keto reductase [Pseudomonas sp. LY10J]NJO99658.1 aldo/keto reductase [Pseudomonas quercus]